jgi:hypothetical protein
MPRLANQINDCPVVFAPLQMLKGKVLACLASTLNLRFKIKSKESGARVCTFGAGVRSTSQNARSEEIESVALEGISCIRAAGTQERQNWVLAGKRRDG